MARRRKRNRKKRNAGFIFPTPLASILVLTAVFSLSYLWLCGRREALGMRIKVLEEQRADARKRRLVEEYKWHNMKSWPNIEKTFARYGLDMDWPHESRVVVIPHSACRFDEEEEKDPCLGGKHLRIAMND